MIESYLKGFEQLASNGGAAAPDWARSLRLSAITRFEALGFPTTKNEDWHFTSVAPIAEREFELLAPPTRGVTRGAARAVLVRRDGLAHARVRERPVRRVAVERDRAARRA